MQSRLSTPQDEQIVLINEQLKAAIKEKNKKEIKRLYYAVTEIDLELVSDELFEEYDSLINDANDIILE